MKEIRMIEKRNVLATNRQFILNTNTEDGKKEKNTNYVIEFDSDLFVAMP